MTEPTEALLPCPFCGGEARFTNPGLPRVMCWRCNGQTGAAKTRIEVADAWNTRAAMNRASPDEPTEAMTPEQQFTEWFVKNYPGPDTIIYNPHWHAPKIFRAAIAAMHRVSPDEDAVERVRIMAKQKLPSEMDDEQLDSADWQGGYGHMVIEARAVFAALTPAKSDGEVND